MNLVKYRQMMFRSIFPKGVSCHWKRHNFIRNRFLHVSSIGNIDSFGTYAVILPSEPYIEGVAHIPMKSVPEQINRPPYVSNTPEDSVHNASDPFAGDPYEGDGRVVLGSDDEKKLRRATKFAKLVLDRTKDWVKVNQRVLWECVLWSVFFSTRWERLRNKSMPISMSSSFRPVPILLPLATQGFPKHAVLVSIMSLRMVFQISQANLTL